MVGGLTEGVDACRRRPGECRWVKLAETALIDEKEGRVSLRFIVNVSLDLTCHGTIKIFLRCSRRATPDQFPG